MGEIKRHVAEGSGLRVLRYQGVSAVTEILHFDSPCESTRGRQKLSSLIVRASQLAEYDIILTTYAILRKEFWHVEADDGIFICDCHLDAVNNHYYNQIKICDDIEGQRENIELYRRRFVV